MADDPIKHLDELAKHEAVCLRLKEIGNKNAVNNLQNVHTPFSLVRDMLTKLNESSKLDGTILTSNLEFIEVMLYDYKVDPTKITYYTDCLAKSEFIKRTPRYNGVTTIVAPFDKLNINMKFDVIVGNPPYQKQVGERKTEPLWDKFVDKAFDLVEEDGHVCMVHPSGWRNVDGRFKKTKDLLNSKQVEYLEMHDKADGKKTFGAGTMYDWYVVKNTDNDKEETTVKFQDGTEQKLNLNELGFVPNGNVDAIRKLIAKDGEERVNVLHSFSDYETRKPHMSSVQHGIYQYPCVYTIRVGDGLIFHYSSTKDKGHFNVPKFIWGNGGYGMGSIVDKNGDYGLTQFAYAIIDDVENLDDIKKAFDSKEFRELMKSCDGGDSNINRKVIALFRKDFWKDFI